MKDTVYTANKTFFLPTQGLKLKRAMFCVWYDMKVVLVYWCRNLNNLVLMVYLVWRLFFKDISCYIFITDFLFNSSKFHLYKFGKRSMKDLCSGWLLYFLIGLILLIILETWYIGAEIWKIIYHNGGPDLWGSIKSYITYLKTIN